MQTLPVPRDQRHRVYVRLAGDDAVFVCPELLATEIVNTDLTLSQVDDRLQSIRWMREKGWLSQADADALRTLLRFGVYETNLNDPQDGTSVIDQCKGALQKVLSLVHHRDVEVEVTYCRDVLALEQAMSAQQKRGQFDYFGLWSTERSRVTMAEGSHIATADEELVPHIGGVDYEFGASQMLVLAPRVTMLNKDFASNQVLLFSAAAAQ